MAAGLQGNVDFVGYPVGQGVPSPYGIPFAGLCGIVDWVGYACGQGLGGAVGTGSKFGGWTRQVIWAIVIEQNQRSILDRLRFEQSVGYFLAQRVETQWAAYQYELAKNRDNAIFATLLAEV